MILDNVVWGFIGCGSVIEKKSGFVLVSILGLWVVVVMCCNVVLVEDYVWCYVVLCWYMDVDVLIVDLDVNVVYVVMLFFMYMQYVLQVIVVGKLVYIEKLMVMDYGECECILEVSVCCGVFVFVVYYCCVLF